MIRGIHYRNRLFYRLQTGLKLGSARNQRFELAASYINHNSRILDVCCGPGDLRKFLPESCHYTALDASSSFLQHLKNHGIDTIEHDIETPLPQQQNPYDVAVMLISLCHLTFQRSQSLLQELTQIARKVIIVEEIVQQKRSKQSRLQHTMNFLAETPYTHGYELMTQNEFENLLHPEGYETRSINHRYMVGIYERALE